MVSQKIYSPDDGRTMGLEGMIEDLVRKCGLPLTPSRGGGTAASNGNGHHSKFALGEWRDIKKIAISITLAENEQPFEYLLNGDKSSSASKSKDNLICPVLGITGTGGAGKSSVTDEIVRRFLNNYSDKTIAVISVDPSRKKTGGALLGDRIRMNSIHHPRAYMRSLATRENDKALSNHVQEAIDICKAAGYDFIILESAGVGQSDASILDYCDVSMYVMTPEYGAASQLEKINMLDYADIVCVNKFDKAGALDALHDVKKQYKRNHGLWNEKDNTLPVIGTVASVFNDPGCNELFNKIIEIVYKKTGNFMKEYEAPRLSGSIGEPIIPAKRVRYLAEIADEIANYNRVADEQAELASQLYQVIGATQIIEKNNSSDKKKNETAIALMEEAAMSINKKLLPLSKKLMMNGKA